MRYLAAVILCLVFLASCVPSMKSKGKTEISDAPVPMSLAVLPVEFIGQAASEEARNTADADFVREVVRTSAQNFLVGKGFMVASPSFVDGKLDEYHLHDSWSSLPADRLCANLGVDGIAYIDIRQWTMVRAAVMDNFVLDATIRLIDKSGLTIGTWSELTQRKNVSIPTSWEGVVGTLLASYFGDSANKQFRYVAFTWADQITKAIPEPPGKHDLPEISGVETNVDKQFFGIGDSVMITVQSEENAKCSFSIGDQLRNIPLRMTTPGEFKGTYTVRYGDKIQNAPLEIRAVVPGKGERFWMESGATVTLVGRRPHRPKKIQFKMDRDGVHIAWDAPSSESIIGFIIERSSKPTGSFSEIGVIREANYTDSTVKQGETYYYRVRSVDRAGNRSTLVRTHTAQIPRFDAVEIFGEVKGKWVPGQYEITGDLTIPPGAELSLQPGTTLLFSGNASLTAKGRLNAIGTPDSPVRFEGARWGGISVSETGSATLSNAVIKGARHGLTTRGPLSARQTSLIGNETGMGIRIDSEAYCNLDSVTLSHWATGIGIERGTVVVSSSKLHACSLGLKYVSGDLNFSQNTLENNDDNVLAHGTLVLDGNFLNPLEQPAGVRGAVIVKSRLDAPPPHGRLVVLEKSDPLSAEEVENRFRQAIELGEQAVSEKQFGVALGHFKQALKYRQDRGVYISLSAIHAIIGETGEAERVLAQALEAFPHDVRLHMVYIKQLIEWGRYDEARGLLEKTKRLAPGDASLEYLQEYLEALTRKVN